MDTSSIYKIASLNLAEFSPSHILLNVTFADPNSITTLVMNPDSLIVQFLDTEYFIDLVDYSRVTNETSLRKELPPQLTVLQQ